MDINSDCKGRWKTIIQENPSQNSQNVKECLLSEKLSNFEILMLNIKNNLLLKSNNRAEIGGTSCDRKNLPAHFDRNFTTFGLSKKDPCTCSDIIQGECISYLTNNAYLQMHLPGTQKNRGYSYPFNKKAVFGKSSNADVQGNKAKKLIHSFEKDLSLKNINCLQNKSHLQTIYFSAKNNQSTKSSSIDEILRQAPIDGNFVKVKKAISHINALRLKLKKRNCSVCFMDLYNHLNCIDKDLSYTVSLDKFYHALKEVNIKPDREMFEFILKEFNFITEYSTVYYMEALNLLNWKCQFPSLFKIYDLPLELQCYSTTYEDSMKLHQ